MAKSRDERKRLEQADIRSGMTLMQTVYTVAMVFGLERVIDASYDFLISPELARRSMLLELELCLILVAIVLLSIRFFWVPRNLNSYILHGYPTLGEKVFSRLTTIHFPIALAHAVLFYFLCRAFVEMVRAGPTVNSPEMAYHASRFVLLYTSLLLLNSVWLFWITPLKPKARRPGGIWATNNIACFTLAVVCFGLWRGLEGPVWALIVPACSFFIVNSIVDLALAAKYYILYER